VAWCLLLGEKDFGWARYRLLTKIHCICTVQQIYYRLFAKEAAKDAAGRNNRNVSRANTNRQVRAGQRPFTRAEALLVMLENNGCPPEQLQTLRNTVQNQDVKVIPPEDFSIEKSK
jgi:hypothetical protein